ncbi:MAG: hypothetical protein ABW318_16965 [Vicinamibacterales bacterium]
MPERLFYMSLPVELIRAMNPQRGAPPHLMPQAGYFTTRVPFTPGDFAAAKRSMACHRTQFTPEVVERVSSAAAAAWNNGIPLVPDFPASASTDVFR